MTEGNVNKKTISQLKCNDFLSEILCKPISFIGQSNNRCFQYKVKFHTDGKRQHNSWLTLERGWVTRVKYLNHEIYYDELVSSLHLPQDQFKLNVLMLNDLINNKRSVFLWWESFTSSRYFGCTWECLIGDTGPWLHLVTSAASVCTASSPWFLPVAL